MTHLPYQERPAEVEVDYVVVGSGAGGATAAVTLARGGGSVAIVEAGPWLDPEDYPSSTYGAMRDLFDDWGMQVARGRAIWPIAQGRAVGGSTVINSAICVRTPGDVFRDWERDHGVGGDAMADALYGYMDELERELHAVPVPAASAGRSNELAKLGGDRVGYDNHVIVRYAKDCQGSGQCLQGCRGRRKQSTNITFVPEVVDRGGIVLSSAPVKKVVFEGRRAIGVTGRFRHHRSRRKGGRFFVRARKAVVVAASATHSAPILQRSGVKSPALGEYFRAHPGTGIFGIYDDPVDMNVGATQGWASTAFRQHPGIKLETLSIPPEMVASRLGGGGRQLMARLSEYRHLAMWCHAVRAESTGTVRNGFGDRPVVKYSLDRPDMERLREGLHILAKTHVAAGAKAVVPCVYGLPYQLDSNDIDRILEASVEPRHYLAILSHLFGGCVMGADPATSVCDDQGRVHGYRGLLVADASAIPTTLGVNPQHTIMALARHFAHRLLDSHRG